MSITSLSMDFNAASELRDALLGGVAAATGTRNSIVLTLGGKETGFNGWASYSDIVGASHRPKEQAKRTTLLFRGEDGLLSSLRGGLPGFDALIRMAHQACAGMRVAFVHVLQQSSPQACFNWHTDTATPGYGRVRKVWCWGSRRGWFGVARDTAWPLSMSRMGSESRC